MANSGNRVLTLSARRPPGVLIVGNFLSESRGTRGVCESLAQRLNLAGWRVLTTSSRPDRLARLAHMLTTCILYRKEYRVAQVDVFSGPAYLWAESVCLALRWMRKPFILTLHGGGLPEFAKKFPGRTKRLLNSAAAVTTPSRFLLERMKRCRADLLLLPNPIDLANYTFTPRGAPRPKLVWLRGFHSIYNPSLAVRALALLRHDFPALELVMAGPDKKDGSLQSTRELTKVLHVSDMVKIPGAVPKSDISRVMNQGDVFLNTTNVDNTPVSVMEAMACGLCVVSTNVGGLPYLLNHEKDALLVEPDDPRAMADAVRRVLTDPALAKRLSGGGREKAVQFAWPVILPQWESLLTSVASGGR